jgi:hypothetical protein
MDTRKANKNAQGRRGTQERKESSHQYKGSDAYTSFRSSQNPETNTNTSTSPNLNPDTNISTTPNPSPDTSAVPNSTPPPTPVPKLYLQYQLQATPLRSALHYSSSSSSSSSPSPSPSPSSNPRLAPDFQGSPCSNNRKNLRRRTKKDEDTYKR